MKASKLVFSKEVNKLSKLVNQVDEIKQTLKRDFKVMGLPGFASLEAKLDKVTGNGYNAVDELSEIQVVEEIEEYID